MRKLYLVLSLFVTVLLLNSCKKENEGMKFEGITMRDHSAYILREEDQTDWTQDPAWSEAEKKLFDQPDTLNYARLAESFEVRFVAAFPNPCLNKFIFNADINRRCVAKVLIVDKHLTPLASLAYATSGGVGIEFDVSDRTKYKVGQTYRVYYAFYNKNKQPFYFGHGDILIDKELEQ